MYDLGAGSNAPCGEAQPEACLFVQNNRTHLGPPRYIGSDKLDYNATTAWWQWIVSRRLWK
jgi:hypothetical protein